MWFTLCDYVCITSVRHVEWSARNNCMTQTQRSPGLLSHDSSRAEIDSLQRKQSLNCDIGFHRWLCLCKHLLRFDSRSVTGWHNCGQILWSRLNQSLWNAWMSLPCLRKLFRALLIWYDMQLQLTGLLFREGIRLEMILFVDCSTVTSMISGLQH